MGTAGGEQAVFRASSFWAQTVDWIKDIVSVADPIQHVIDGLRQARLEGKIAVVGREYFPVGDYQALEVAFSKESLVDLTPQVDQLQAIKSPRNAL